MTNEPTIWVLNGPNLNMLGTREPEIYGRVTLKQIEKSCEIAVESINYGLVFKQSNHEGVLVDWIQEAATAGGLIINAGAYTHTSIAIHDALRAISAPIIEVHLSNPYGRERFRRRSYISSLATGVICGLGAFGYICAINALNKIISEEG